MRLRVLPVLLLLSAPLTAQERTVPLDTVRVTASSRASGELAAPTRGVEVITAEEIRRTPARTVAEALEWALGVDLMPRSPALADVAVRGSSFEQVLVLVDGVRASDAQTGHFDLNLAVPLEQVERIEILRGPGSALHGADAVGGVIHIVTRGAGVGPHARAEAGSFATQGLALSHAFEAGGVRADLAGDLRRSDGHRPGTDYRVGTGRAALSAPLAGRTLRADAAHAARDFGADGFYAPFPSYEETRTTTASLGWRAEPEAGFAVEPVLSLRRHGDDFVLKRSDPSFYRNRHTTWQAGGEVTARWRVSPLLRLAGGTEWYRDAIRSATLGDRAERRAAVLAEAAAGRVGHAAATAGVRADWHEAYGTVWSPSASGAWWPTERVRLRASAGSAFRAPTWTERYYRDPANQGDPALRPERSWSGEAGVDAHLPAGVRIGVAGFVREAADLIDWARPAADSVSPWRTRNVEEARFRGVEAEAAWRGPLGVRWTGRGTWLSVRTDEAAGWASKYALRPLVETLSLGAERAFANGLSLSLRGQRARRAGEDAHLRVDGRAAYTLRGARLYADVHNALDEAYPDITGRPAAGRALSVGVEWRGKR